MSELQFTAHKPSIALCPFFFFLLLIEKTFGKHDDDINLDTLV